MAGLLYFFPGTEDLGVAATLGLDRIFESRDADLNRCVGPGGKAGLLAVPPVLPAGERPSAAYFPAEQLWDPAPSGNYWIGRMIAKPPRPLDLMRRGPVDGYVVELADRQSYIVPVARSLDGATPLPQKLRLGADGQWAKGDVVERFAGLWKRACRSWDLFLAESGRLADGQSVEPGTEQELIEIAVYALAVNYRVGPAEVSVLGLLDTQIASAVCRCIADVPEYLRVEAERIAAAEDPSKKGRAG